MKNIHRFCKMGLLMALLVGALFALSSCSSSDSAAKTSNVMPIVLDQKEYVLSQNIFYNDAGAAYVGKSVTKKGIFATLVDVYNGKTRYYVWGYNDNTKCCDWQWELVPTDTENLPTNGSLIEAKGTFRDSTNALDGYWISGAKIDVITEYTGPSAEVDMSLMSDTLERVQLANVMRSPERFEGKTFSAVGRITATGEIEDPYYDNSWSVPYSSSETAPAVGKEVTLRGVISEGVLSDCTFTVQ